ncbi:MAG TPA: hemerythrin domain-containing protein [Candidatus Limnocylindrales bacterium]|nr:hemerythrin domain-containing protein [Candidatus Limnocylindrales bacterium]
MTLTLPQVGHVPHERILEHVNHLPEMADRLLSTKGPEFRREVDEVCGFLTGVLVEHLEDVERTLYPQLERMYQNRHSMSPMRREHVEVRRLVAEFSKLTELVDAGHLNLGRTLALRRVLFQLYALLKIHLAEEEVYLHIADHDETADVGELLAAAIDHPGFRPA